MTIEDIARLNQIDDEFHDALALFDINPEASMARQRKLRLEKMEIESRLSSTYDKKFQVGGTHYADNNIEPFQVIADWCGDEGFAAYLRGNCIKYLCRYQDKNGVEDLQKCQHYLAELINLETNMAAKGGRNG